MMLGEGNLCDRSSIKFLWRKDISYSLLKTKKKSCKILPLTTLTYLKMDISGNFTSILGQVVVGGTSKFVAPKIMFFYIGHNKYLFLVKIGDWT
jgi:hypothetical protein